MDRQSLEQRLAQRPQSPLFVRFAGLLLEEGESRRAAEVCIEGLKYHPGYSTAHLLLARAYEALGRTVQSIVELRKASRAVPDCGFIQEAIAILEAREAAAKRPEERVSPLSTSGPPPAQHPVPSLSPPAPPKAQSSPRIITATLADIYASQGEYAEAISTYQKLIVLRPAEADRYRRRIFELEDLRKRQEQVQVQGGKKVGST